jgi:hypothetical protein
VTPGRAAPDATLSASTQDAALVTTAADGKSPQAAATAAQTPAPCLLSGPSGDKWFKRLTKLPGSGPARTSQQLQPSTPPE